MSKQGGAATVYGILYQILGSIDWAVRLQLTGDVKGDVLNSALLILEPDDGGDIQVNKNNIRIVEQWKSRSSKRPWSFGEIVKKVLPDLYRATDTQQQTELWFVTEGRCSDWSEARKLFSWMKQQVYTESIKTTLNSQPDKYYRGKSQRKHSAYQFFCWIVNKIDKSATTESNGSFKIIKHDVGLRVWELLSYFNIRTVDLLELENSIDQILLKYVNSDSEISEKREQLCGVVLKLASSQNSMISPSELLRRVDLDHTSLDSWRNAFELINKKSFYSLEQWGFSAKHDVRITPTWPTDKPCILITGDSGYGKSFTLGSIGVDVAGDEHAVIALRAKGNAKQTLESVARKIWGDGFHRNDVPSLELVASKLQKYCHNLKKPWLTILIDELIDASEARELLEFNWDEYGIFLAIATSSNLSNILEKQYQDILGVYQLKQFSALEVKEYLSIYGIDWADLPEDVREIITWPLLAKLYCNIAHENTWKPENEYSLFQKTWERITYDLRQANFPDDQSNLRFLINETIEDRCNYPWSVQECLNYGIDVQAINRLIAIGWLQREEGKIRIWHNRLLCWAVAVALADDFRNSGEDALPKIKKITHPDSNKRSCFKGVNLLYVPMDLMWLSCDEKHGNPRKAHLLLKALKEDVSRRQVDLTYEQLPSLGKRIIGPILEELRLSQLNRASVSIKYIASILQVLAKRNTKYIAELAVEMLGFQELKISACGVILLKKISNPKALDGIWNMRIRFKEWSETASGEERKYLTFENSDIEYAMKSCVRMEPSWLTSTIATTEDKQQLDDLTDILSSCESDEAIEVWNQCKSKLINYLGEGSVSLAACIDRFNEKEEIPRILDWLEHDDRMIAVAAIECLTAICPGELIKILPLNRKTQDWLILNDDWLPALMVNYCDSVNNLILKLLQSSDSHSIQFQHGFLKWSNQFNPEIVKELIKKLEDTANDCCQSLQNDHGRQLTSLLQFFQNICTSELLAQISSKGGTPLESVLVKIGKRYVDEAQDYHSDLEALLLVLLRLQGEGLEQLIGYLVSSRNNSHCSLGLKWCCYVRSENIRQRLKEIVFSQHFNNDNRPPYKLLQHNAISYLALFGEEEELIQSLLHYKHNVLEIVDAREGYPPMANAVINKLKRNIKNSGNSEKCSLALQAVGVTGRRDLIPILHSYLKKNTSTSPEAFGAISALAGLSARDSVSIEYYKQHLQYEDHNYIASNGLLRSDNYASRIVLLEYLEQSFSKEFHSTDDQIASILTKFPETRDRALAIIEQHTFQDKSFMKYFKSHDHLRVAGTLTSERIQTELLKEANAAEGGVNIVGRKVSAIRGLAIQDKQEAVKAAWRAFKEGQHNRELYPSLLIDLDGENVIEGLYNSLKTEESQLVRRSIGLALRKSDHHQLINDIALHWMSSNFSCERWIAAEIARWMGPPFLDEKLQEVLRSDRIKWVRRQAGDALYHFEQQKNMAQLLQAIPRASLKQQWLYIRALFQLDDVSFLGTKGDALWIAPVLDNLPRIFFKHVNKQYKDQMKKNNDDLKNKKNSLPYSCNMYSYYYE